MERPGSRTQTARRRRARLGLSRHAWHLPIVSGDPRCQPSPSVSYANGAHGVPEICQKLRYAQPHAVPRHHPLTVLLTCAVVWGREVLHGVVSPPRIDGKDGVAGSIPAGGSTTNPQLRPGPAPALFHARRKENRQLPAICQQITISGRKNTLRGDHLEKFAVCSTTLAARHRHQFAAPSSTSMS